LTINPPFPLVNQARKKRLCVAAGEIPAGEFLTNRKGQTMKTKIMHICTNSNGTSWDIKSKTDSHLATIDDRDLLNNKPNAQFIVTMTAVEVPDGHAVVFGKDKHGKEKPENTLLLTPESGKWDKRTCTPFMAGCIYAVPIQPEKTEREKKLEEIGKKIDELNAEFKEVLKGE